jgi:hypothetical protein
MQHNVTIRNDEGSLRVPDEQLELYEMFLDLKEEMQVDCAEQDPGNILLRVVNFPIKCFKAVFDYTAYCLSQGFEPTEATPGVGINITPAEAEIVSALKTYADFRSFVSVSYYLGNRACMYFSLKLLLRFMALQQLVAPPPLPLQIPESHASTPERPQKLPSLHRRRHAACGTTCDAACRM